MWLSRIIPAILSISLVHAVAINRHDLRKRETFLVEENVIITEQVNVFRQLDGTEVTGEPVPIATSHSTSDPILIPEQKDENETIPELAVPQAPETSIPPKSKEDLSLQKPSTDSHPAQPDIHPDLQSVQAAKSTEPAEELRAQSAPVTETNNVLAQDSSKDNLASTVPSEETSIVSIEASKSPKSGGGKNSKVAASSRAKRGIAYNDVSKLSAFTSSKKVSWAYNWGSSSPKIPSNVEYVPMLWGTGSQAVGWNENADKAIASGSTHLLSFNEPDLGEQSSMSVSEAVSGYQQLMQPYAGKAKLGSPAVTNGAAPMGLSYLQSFISACSGCTIDFVAIHWYNGGSADDFKNYVTKAHAAGGGRPIWITEFEGSGDAGQQKAFLNEVLPWLDNQDYVERYAYFMASDGNLISSGTTPSQVGQAYAFDI